MTTQSWSTGMRHDSDAAFRAWGSEIGVKLAAINLVQTADTGQINWATVTLPGANTSGGYEIWRFNDSLQATAPIYFRIDYNTANANQPKIVVTVGTGSNGSGTITGTAKSAANAINGQSAQTSATAFQSYFCHVDGFLGMDWKNGSGLSEGNLLIIRTVDSSGAPTAVGAMVCWGVGSGTSITGRQFLRFAATAAAATLATNVQSGALGINPGAASASLVGSDVQVFIAWANTPQIQPLVGICGVLKSEIAVGNTFAATLVGSTSRTYIVLPDGAGPFGPITIGTAGALNQAMLWE